MKTEVSLETYNGHNFISIWEIDQNGVRYPKPLISLGKKKFLSVIEKAEEIKQLLGINQTSENQDYAKDLPF